MDNKYLFAVVAGVFAFVWFWVGVQPFYAADAGGISAPFLWTAVVVLALGGGDSEGSDLMSVLSGSITVFIPTFIGLTIAFIVGSALFEVVMGEAAFDYMQVVKAVGTLFASGVAIILTVACLKKAS